MNCQNVRPGHLLYNRRMKSRFANEKIYFCNKRLLLFYKTQVQ